MGAGQDHGRRCGDRRSLEGWGHQGRRHDGRNVVERVRENGIHDGGIAFRGSFAGMSMVGGSRYLG